MKHLIIFYMFEAFSSTKVTILFIISFVITFSASTPFKYNIWLSFPPPVIPISVCFASPGPLTTQPIIDSVIGFLI